MALRSFPAFAFTLLLAPGLPLQAQTSLMIEAYPGSEERQSERVTEAFGRSARITGFSDGRLSVAPFEGRVTLMRLRNPSGRSGFEILHNYRTALEERGFELEWECSGRTQCGTISDGGWRQHNGMNMGAGGTIEYFTGQMMHEGALTFVSVAFEPANHYIQILESEPMEEGLIRVLDADEMASALETEGRLAIDNIHFAFGSAELLPESDEALTQVAQLLADRPGVALYVVGHTDSIGGFEANMALSQRRAAAVVTALEQQFSIASGRAVPAGVGPLAPLASNASDAGRALNRRVEIVLR